MIVRKHRRLIHFIIVLVLVVSYISLGELATAYAYETSFANIINVDSYYIEQNNRRLFGLILIGVVLFGAVKGWRRGVVLGCFLMFLGFASVVIFIHGKLIATWLNYADSKFIPAVVFFLGGILLINLLHKIYNLMYSLLKKYLYKM